MRRLACFFIVVLSGCSTVHSRAVDRAMSARERGDLVAEAFAWQEACDAKPGDARACGAFKAAAQEVLVHADGICQETAPEDCLRALEPGLRLLPGDETATRWVEISMRRHVEICGESDTSQIAASLERLACLSRLPLAIPSWKERLSSARIELAAEMRRRGVEATQLAPSFAWDGAASCLDGESFGSDVSFGSVALPIQLKMNIDGVLLPDLCERLQYIGIVCGAGTVFESTGWMEIPRYWVSDSTHETIYEAGRRRLPNPSWALAGHRVDAAERAYQFARLEADLAMQACEEADRGLTAEDRCFDCPKRKEKDRICDGATERDRFRSSRRWELDEARRAQGEEPEFLDEPILRTHRYVQHTHHWEAAYEVKISGRPIRGTLIFQDREHQGFEPAGLSADPFEQPDHRDFEEALAARLLPLLEAEIRAWAGARARERKEACPGPAKWDDDWLGCWTESTLWSGTLPRPGHLVRDAGIGCRAPNPL